MLPPKEPKKVEKLEGIWGNMEEDMSEGEKSQVFVKLKAYLAKGKPADSTLSVDGLHLGRTNETITVVAPFSSAILADGFARIERHSLSGTDSLNVECIVMPATTYGDLRKFGRDLIDPETRRARLKSGFMGVLWGATVIINNDLIVDGKEIVAFCAEEFRTLPEFNWKTVSLVEVTRG